MNSHSEEYRAFCHLTTLRAAWERVEDADGCAGVDGITLERYADDLESNLERLRAELLTDSYQPLPLLRFFVSKSSGGQRPLCVLAVRDRVAQHAAMAVIGPRFEAEFEACSWAYRRGRSVRQALDEVERLRAAGYVWVVDADIQGYFENVSPELLLGRVQELVTEPRLLNLISQWISARIYDGQQMTQMQRGLPQGAPISPLLANLYLDTFDEQMMAEGHRLVRFADDFLVLCKTRPKAEEALRLTERTLAALRLALNNEKTRITSFADGFKFLGATFVHSLCLTPPPGDRKAQNVSAAVVLPPVLPILRGSGAARRNFNPALRDGLRRALDELTDQPVPSFYAAARRAPAAAKPVTESAASEATETRAEQAVPMMTSNDEPPDSGDDAQAGPTMPSLVTLRTLYLQDHGVVLRCEDEHLRVTKDEIELLSLPAFKLDQIVLLSNALMTTPALKFCLRNDIPVMLLTGQGDFYGVIESTGNQNVLLQQRQFARLAEPQFVLETARQIVAGKISNCRTLLQRRQRAAPDERLREAVSGLDKISRSLADAATVDEVRGYEGAASAKYFSALAACFQGPFIWQGRARRPPPDPLNAMLSFGYTLLFQNLYAIVRARGLSPYVGSLHALRQGHPALCSDLIEEFRAPVVDALVTALVNKRMLAPADFQTADDGKGCYLTAQARRTFVTQFEQRINSLVTHPRVGIRTTWRGCIDLQVGQYIRTLWGDADRYEPMVIR